MVSSITQTAVQRERRVKIKQAEQSLQELWTLSGGLTYSSLEFQKERENRAEEIFEEIITPNRTNTHTLRLLKAKENKEKILKAAREKEKNKDKNLYHASLQNLCKLQNSGVT